MWIAANPIVVAIVNGFMWFGNKLPLIFSVLCLVGGVYGLFKFRETLVRSVVSVVSKLTRRRR